MPQRSTNDLFSLKATSRAYGGLYGYEKEQKLGRTSLDYVSWLISRTPDFRKCFGDWETLRAQRKLDLMEPILVPMSDSWKSLDLSDLRKAVISKLKTLKANKETGQPAIPMEHPELGLIFVNQDGIGKTANEGADPAKILIASEIKTLLPKAIYSHIELPRREKGPQTLGYATLYAKVTIERVPLIAIFNVERRSNGDWYYNTAVRWDPENEMTRRFRIGGLTNSLVQGTPRAGLRDSRRRFFDRVKPSSVSGAVSHLGEPSLAAIGDFCDQNKNFYTLASQVSEREVIKSFTERAWRIRKHFRSAVNDEARGNALEAIKIVGEALTGAELTAIPLKRALVDFVSGKCKAGELDKAVANHLRGNLIRDKLYLGRPSQTGRDLCIDF